MDDDDLYYCVPDCNHAPFTARKQHSAHQRLCKKAQAHERYLATLASARQDAEEVLEPSPKRVRVVEPDIGDVARSPSPDPPPASPPPPPSPSEVVETRNQAPPPPPRLTRAQARQLDTAFRRERDALPEAPAQLEPLPPPPIDTGARHPASTAHRPHARDPFRTDPDIFGRYRVYYSRPPRIPDADAPMAHVLPFFQTPPAPRFPRPLCDVIAPCPNISVFYVLRYHWLSGNTKSLNDREYLCNEVLLQPDFKPRDLAGINLNAVDKELAAAANNWDPSCPPAEGWKNVPLKLRVPTPSSALPKRPRKRARLPDPPPEPEPPENYLVIDGLRAQSLTGLMKKTFSHNNIDTFNYDTYQYCWKPPGSSGPAQTLSGEMYTSPAMIRAYREVQGLDIDCDLPRCVAGFMFMSDGMQFAQFSHVKGWPILCSFGNESKYERCKPTSNTCFPIAHIPTLPDKVREQITAMHGKPPSDDLITHLRRELMHAVWLSLLDDEFIDAWKNGVVIDCADGIRRRVFPRIMTYSADYPEKVLLATIRNNGKCFCPRCFVTKPTASQMGTPTDMRTRKKRRIDNPKRRATIKQAKHLIHKKGKTVGSKAVEALLKDKSYVPTMNAFSERLGDFKFNFFATLVVDQLHEVELGVWKALFQHLIRLLHSVGPAAVTEFNRRFRAVPTFASTIRLFADDVADMGRIAARDYEDILQCSIPAFKGLLPKICDEPAQTLLFLFAEWHGLAKLRLHTTDSLKIFKSITTKLGTAIRTFVKLTDGLKIRETPKEYARRKKQSEASKAKQMSRRAPTTANTTRANKTSTQQNPDDGDGRRIVTLNLNTYKFHSTGDYPWHVEEYGTSDSYSTQIGELQNRKYKAQYGRTNKRDAIEQMTEIEDIMNTLQAIDKELKESLKRPRPRIDAAAIDSLTEGRPYHIGQKDRSEDMVPSIPVWVANQAPDSAVRFFYPQLKRHLLARLRGVPNGAAFNESELAQLTIHQQRMWRHKTLRVNYTSYDVLRQQDVLNAGTSHCFVMLPAEITDTNPHPFAYAKVLGVYHAKVVYGGRVPERMDFVHVRWLNYDRERPGGWDHKRLDRLFYPTCKTPEGIWDSFDFIDPANILRATHLIPDFCSDTTRGILNLKNSIAYDNKDFGDWNAYYVNRFVDRDMLMRYIGGGVGHYRQTADNVRAAIPDIQEEEDENENIDENEDEIAEAGDEGEQGDVEGVEDAEDEDTEDEDTEDEDMEVEVEDEDNAEDMEDEEDVGHSDVEGSDVDPYDYDELGGF